MKHAWKAGVAALATLGPALSAGAAEPTARLLEWGEIRVERSNAPVEKREDSVTFIRPMVSPPVFLRRTDAIVARLCQQFGVEVLVQAAPGQPLPPELEVIFSHPRMTRPDGVSGDRSVSSTAVTPVPPRSAGDAAPDAVTGAVTGRTAYSFTFDYTWEMEPGAWTFEFRANGAALVAKTFTVTKPEGAPVQSVCEAGRGVLTFQRGAPRAPAPPRAHGHPIGMSAPASPPGGVRRRTGDDPDTSVRRCLKRRARTFAFDSPCIQLFSQAARAEATPPCLHAP